MRTYPHPAAGNLPLCAAVTFDVLGRLLPRARVEDALAACGCLTERTRKLDLVLIVFLIVAMHLCPESQHHVLWRLVHALRLVWPTDYQVPGASAIPYRRREVGIRPLVALVRQLCRPLATPQTPGAFLNGLRLVAIDSHTQAVPDTPANERAFGRPANQHGPGAYPQVRGVYLVECGTHAILDATFWPIGVNEHTGARRVVRSVTADMLVLWDRGLYSVAQLERVRARSAHVLCRIATSVRPRVIRLLPDGSYLAVLHPDASGHQVRAVRLIEYVLPHPHDPTREEVYRLITTLLDWQQFPALTLATTYHERWEIELVLDELTVHQRPAQHPLRSRTPHGVLQELYGLVLAHYAVRAVMYEAACAQQVDPDRVSFVHTLHLIQLYLPELQRASPATRDRLYQRLVDDVGARLLPPRRDRQCPRFIKRRINRYTMRTPARVAAYKRGLCERRILLI